MIPATPDARLAPPAGESDRVRLARLARVTALWVPGVLGTDTGPMGVVFTAAGGERLEGVTVVASSSGGYDVSLRLVCALVPLPELGQRVSAAVAARALAARLPVGAVSVHVAAVADPLEQPPAPAIVAGS